MANAKSTNVELTHFGRKSGKPFRLEIWFLEIEGEIWIGSRDDTRNWTRNLRANGRAELDFGQGPNAYKASPEAGAADARRFDAGILAAHPWRGRLIRWMSRGKNPCYFRLRRQP